MTRRGFGTSVQTSTGYSINTLAKDILAVVDALHLDKVIVIGHSIAGDEISKFASSYPNRVEKIVYLDSAHDRMYRLDEHRQTLILNIYLYHEPGSDYVRTEF